MSYGPARLLRRLLVARSPRQNLDDCARSRQRVHRQPLDQEVPVLVLILDEDIPAIEPRPPSRVCF